MSDILIHFGKKRPNFDKSTFYFSKKDWIVETEIKQLSVLFRRNDKKDIWSPVITPTGTSIFLVGRIVLDEKSWEFAAQLLGDGGIACKYINHLLEQHGIDALPERLNGAFAIFIHDEQQDGYIVTDRMGFIPIYYKYDESNTTISTYLDAIENKDLNHLDLVSIGEYLNYGRIEFPNTYYKNIKQLEAGAIFRVQNNTLTKVVNYYKPKFNWKGEKSKQLINELANALKEAVNERTLPFLGNSGVFLSGGMDSRGILASCNKPGTVTTSTFYDEVNEEYQTASEIAKRYRAKHLGLKRNKEHYIENAAESVALMNGQWDVLDGHYTGFVDQLLNLDVDNWLSGCFADWMFKGLASNTRYMKFLGKNIPTIKYLDKFDPVYYKPKFDVAKPSLTHEIEVRKNNILSEINNYTGEEYHWNLEKIRLFPMNREPDMGSRHILSRVLRWDPVLADNRLIDLFERMPVSYKLEKYIWGNAIAKICRGNNDIKDNNWGTSVDANNTQRFLSFLQENIKRKIIKSGKKANNSITTVGSWPNFYHVTLESEALPKIWQSISKNSFAIIEEITEIDYSNKHYLDIAKENLNYFYRLLTLLLWLEHN